MGPYADAAWAYRRAGWDGVLPLPPGSKGPPPRGFTGWAGAMPSGADIQAWLDGTEAAGNIALRLPPGVYGLDVDAYGGKGGAAALAALTEQCGPLPDTWVVTSRDDGVSGIRLFRAALEPGRRWRDEPGGHGAGIEAIHFGHRYAVVWPSVHPDTGRKYTWSSDYPTPDMLPELPAAWCEALSELGEVRAGTMAGHTETLAVVNGWRDGDPCAWVTAAAVRSMGRLLDAIDGAALHPAAMDSTHELVSLGHEGHAGVRAALATHYSSFIDVRLSRGADHNAAAAEWWRLVRGACGKLVGAQTVMCDCDLRAGAGVQFEPDPPAAALSYPSVTFLEDDAPAAVVVIESVAPRRVDLRPYVDGTYAAPEPTRGAVREGGAQLLYPGRWHTVVGPTGAGKSWYGLVNVRDELAAWRPAVYLHFEEHSPGGTVARLRALGVERDAIVERFIWLDCDRMWERGELAHELASIAPGLVVLDGINAACTRHGFDPSTVEAVGWYRDRFVMPAVAAGAAVVSLGHPPKAKDRQDERHGFGSTAWLDECDGVGFRLTASKTPVRRGAHGFANLYSVKDRYGSVEALGQADGRDGWVYLGSLHVDDSGEATSARLSMPAPGTGDSAPLDPIDELGAAIVTVLTGRAREYPTERVLIEWLRSDGVKVTVTNVAPALDRLERSGRITRDPFVERRARSGRLADLILFDPEAGES